MTPARLLTAPVPGLRRAWAGVRSPWPTAGSARPGVRALPAGAPVWTFWQYTSTGSVPGLAGNVDRNEFNGARDRLIALASNTP